MKRRLIKGEKKIYRKLVKDGDVAAFQGNVVHFVCSTYALARDIEWSSRLFVLDVLEEGEEGIGTMLQIEHLSPAMVGQEIEIEATIDVFQGNELICDIEVKVGKRIVAKGKTGQKILKKESIVKVFSTLE